MSNFPVLDVDDDATVDEVASNAGVSIAKGSAFYLLGNKQENVSAGKRIVAIDKNTKDVFADDEARTKLKFSGAGKVKASQWPGFDVFIQTTSTNRKLKAPTKICYDAGGAGGSSKAAGTKTKAAAGGKRKRDDDDDDDGGDEDGDDDDDAPKKAKAKAKAKPAAKKPAAKKKAKGSDDDGGDDDDMGGSGGDDDDDDKPKAKKAKTIVAPKKAGAAAAGGGGGGVNPKRFPIVDVDDDATVDEVASAQGLSIGRGDGYYLLQNKKENVNVNKRIVIKHKTTGEVYNDEGARKQIKLTATKEIKATDYPEWQVFIQSTSANRKLKAPTKLLYENQSEPLKLSDAGAAAAAGAAGSDGDADGDDDDGESKPKMKKQPAKAAAKKPAAAAAAAAAAPASASSDLAAAMKMMADAKAMMEQAAAQIAAAAAGGAAAVPAAAAAAAAPAAGKGKGKPVAAAAAAAAAGIDAAALKAQYAQVFAKLPAEQQGEDYFARMQKAGTEPAKYLPILKQMLDTIDEHKGDLTELCINPLCDDGVPEYRDADCNGDEGYAGKSLDAKVPLGGSKTGGFPHLPPNFEWPHYNEFEDGDSDSGEPKKCYANFLAQVNCRDVAPYDIRGLLPATGMLYFFWYGDSIKAPGVVHYDGPLDALVKNGRPPKSVGDDDGRLRLVSCLPMRNWEFSKGNSGFCLLSSEAFDSELEYFDPAERSAGQDGTHEMHFPDKQWVTICQGGGDGLAMDCWACESWMKWSDIKARRWAEAVHRHEED